MILVDTNLLVYAHVSSFRQHESARDWLDRQLNGSARVGLPWQVIVGFLRLVTNPRVFDDPEPMSSAWAQARAWLACEVAWIPEPTSRHEDVIDALFAEPGVSGNLIPDAHLAAIAIEHGLTLCSSDTDFARFPGLRWENPIAPRRPK